MCAAITGVPAAIASMITSGVTSPAGTSRASAASRCPGRPRTGRRNARASPRRRPVRARAPRRRRRDPTRGRRASARVDALALQRRERLHGEVLALVPVDRADDDQPERARWHRAAGARARSGIAIPTGLSSTFARAPSNAPAIQGEIATTVSASAPWKRKSARTVRDFGASWAWTITGTRASRAASTGETSTVLLATTTCTPRLRMMPARRTVSGTARARSSAQRAGETPQIGSRLGARTIAPRASKCGRSAPWPTAVTSTWSGSRARAWPSATSCAPAGLALCTAISTRVGERVLRWR